jgi:hypothetical protein
MSKVEQKSAANEEGDGTNVYNIADPRFAFNDENFFSFTSTEQVCFNLLNSHVSDFRSA